ncbi:biotin transporter BioY [Fructilactobacillus sanfranciscensis]|uniref:biotin transporter BioY n=1 Tax=Fructilactobacillus sanfranciscensis TaxID=1625 RepID=UPI000D49AFDF|nr:biotin transporter BioY [Fructilactobacillus sanfranciscensis]POH15478.1 biotin biosynthesis protein BioY [Fructilactobacillus sanfranciscensis]POH18963.1 biotin biosynthesis protein BioY [Fructilactobacillus sanfranciscensis]
MKIKEITYCGVMIAIIVAFSLVPPIAVPVIPVPISFQTMAVMLAGSLLGKKLGTISVLIFLLLVAVGMPLLIGGRGGFSIFLGPTAGYLLSWPISAFSIGWLLEKIGKLNFWKYLIANLIGGMLVMNLIGAIGLSFIIHMPILKAIISTTMFFPGDIIKTVIVAFIAVKLQQTHIIKLDN